MTGDEHRAEAKRHETSASHEAAQYDATSNAVRPGRSVPNAPPDLLTYNPTQHHLAVADNEMRAAAGHLAAAKKLEAFEDARCRAIPPAERAACPLLASSVSVVRETEHGVQLVLKLDADADEVARRLNCHLAYAEATGFARPSCPLFVRGMKIALAGPGVIGLTGETPEVVTALKLQARRIFGGEEPSVSTNP